MCEIHVVTGPHKTANIHIHFICMKTEINSQNNKLNNEVTE